MRGPRMVRFLRAVYRDNARRLPEQRRSLARDLRLHATNLALRPRERHLLRRYRGEPPPLVFIVGVPRSGTTLLYQLMARHLHTVYVNNFAARYWLAPLVALRSFRARWAPDGAERESLRSSFGGTEGPAAPHEFTYFWQYWTDFGATDRLTEPELDRVAWSAIREELAAIATWAELPLVSKCLTFADYHVARFAREFPAAKFVWIARQGPFVARSILESRRRRYGSEAVWWSIRPHDVAVWRERDPLEQVCHQIRDVERALDEGFSGLAADRGLRMSYEALVADPRAELERVACFVPTTLRPATDLERLRLGSRNLVGDDSALLDRARALLER